MKFKENSLLEPAISIFWRHLGGVMIAFIFSIPLSQFLVDNITGQIICSILFLFIYSIPSYTALWAIGHRDLNKEKFGHVNKDIYKGLKIGLIASIPSFIFALLFILSKFNIFPFNIVVPFKFVNAELFPLINLIQPSMYMPDFSIAEVFGIAALTLIPAVLCFFFYILGNKDFKPTSWLVYKKDTNEKKTNVTSVK